MLRIVQGPRATKSGPHGRGRHRLRRAADKTNGAPGAPGAHMPRALAAPHAGQRDDDTTQLLLTQNDEHTLQHMKKLVQNNNNNTEQTMGEQVSACGDACLTRGERQVPQQVRSAQQHKRHKHKKRYWQLIFNFQDLSTSDESAPFDTEHIGDENSTRRTRHDAQQATQQVRARAGTARVHASTPCTLQ
jgi:hypothetical protein